MKVRITKEAKKWLTLEMAPVARQIVADLKNPENGYESCEEVLMRAARVYYQSFENRGEWCALDWPKRVLEARAEIAGNQRVHDYWGTGSGTLDVWVSGLVLFNNGVLEIGSYLSDIWALGAYDADGILVAHSFIREFVERKR